MIKQEKDGQKNEWMLNGCGMNTKESDRNERSALSWFDNTNRINVEQTEKQIYEE